MRDPAKSILLTDLYQLTMLQSYYRRGMEQTAVFEFFVRDLPESRSFLMAAGLEQALQFLEQLRFEPDELAWIAGCGLFGDDFVDHLANIRFTGDVHAMPEGTIFFPNEPIIRITAPLPQAQLVESRLINLLHFQTLIASKASRAVLTAPDKMLVDFGLRRAHGAEAGLLAARASYLAGFTGTATTLAAPLFDIPVFGTMAHSFIQAHDDEAAAFEHFARTQPGNVVLLIDTYDTEAAAAKIVDLAPRLHKDGITIKAIRIDSGDLADHALRVRKILDDGGLNDVDIFASGNLNEYLIEGLINAQAPINGFGIGTHMDTSSDAPYLDCAYKLQEYAGKPRRKRSEGKATWPGRKQVYRRYDETGLIREDLLTVEGDLQDGDALIAPVMYGGKRLTPPTPLEESRKVAADQLARLPLASRRLMEQGSPLVVISDALQKLAAATDEHIS